MSASAPNIVILRSLGLGDFLTAIPALRGINRAFPRHTVSLYMPKVLQPLIPIAGLNMQVVHSPRNEMIVPEQRADIAINLHGRGPQSHRTLLASAPRRLIAFANGEIAETISCPQWNDSEHEVHRWCRLLEESGIKADPDDLDLDRSLLTGKTKSHKNALVHAGASATARQWPVSRWADVATALASSGYQVKFTGTNSEKLLVHNIIQDAGMSLSTDFTGTALLALCKLVANASLVVAGDTGVSHLATALQRPSVTLFGPTPPSLWGPPASRPWNYSIWKGTSGNANASTTDAGLLAITTKDVLSAIATVETAVEAVSESVTSAHHQPSQNYVHHAVS